MKRIRRVGIFLGGFPIIPAGLITGVFYSRWNHGGSLVPFVVMVLVDILCLYCMLNKRRWIISEFRDRLEEIEETL